MPDKKRSCWKKALAYPSPKSAPSEARWWFEWEPTLCILPNSPSPAARAARQIFSLPFPGKIARHYRGTLELKPGSGALVAVVSLDLETAVASVVAAESLSGAPLEALKAQAVAARSYFAAGKGRHSEFDFCDTTHCQFLREPPGPGTAAEAASATRGLVMVYQSQPFAAMYTRSCSGRARTPVELGLSPDPYPYYSVDCKYCREHPSRWQSRISARDAASLRSPDESSRLKMDRRLGWSTAPSNSFARRNEGDHAILEGVGQGPASGSASREPGPWRKTAPISGKFSATTTQMQLSSVSNALPPLASFLNRCVMNGRFAFVRSCRRNRGLDEIVCSSSGNAHSTAAHIT